MPNGGTSAGSSAPNQPAGTILSFYIPADTSVNIANMLELATPTGICVALRMPFISSLIPAGSGLTMAAMLNTMKKMGGSFEFLR